MSIIRKAFKIFNGSVWDEYHLKTDSKQVIHTKADGTDTTVAEQLLALNSTLNRNTIFSNIEQEIGVWINGKKLYRKVIAGSLDASSQTLAFPTGLNGSNEYVTIERAMWYDGKGGCLPIPFCTFSDLKFAIGIYVTNNFGSIIVERGSAQLKISTFYASVLYTK